ncbi:MAG TPA: DNA-binding transcriptional regulator [Verrucomicrobiae bacterium]|nr:DNA-binding transcriptional regulator [Verrucomicrobiae bacterium]
MKARPKKRHVALLVESSRNYIRELLLGVAKFVRVHGLWSVEFQEGISTETLPPWFAGRKWDGIIAEVSTSSIARSLKDCSFPVVDVNGDAPESNFPVVRSDDVLIGRMAAEHLISRGFRRFAFCGFKEAAWSDLRRTGFERRVAEAGFGVQVFDNADSWRKHAEPQSDSPGRSSEQTLRNWVRSLPKPVGVMACNDERGWQVLGCCLELNVTVPEELAVIGVDNDEIFCELSRIPLSSVILNARQIGYEAAALLEQLMAGKTLAEPTLKLNPVTVAERRSTDALAIEDPRLMTATRLIREHACEGLDVNSLLKKIPMSRRVLERQFVKLLGRTPKAEILRVRLDRVRQLLSESDLKLSVVADKAGFHNPEHMCRLFKKKYGITPGEYRIQTTLDR